MQPTKFALFWATWKLRIIAGVAVLAALAIAIYAAHGIGYQKGKNLSEVAIVRYEREAAQLRVDVVMARAKVNEKIVTKIVTQTQFVERVSYQNREIVRRVVIDRPINQTVTKGWIYAHNQFALGLPIDPALAADKTISGVLDTKILDRVADNYRIGQNAINLAEAFQEYHRNTEKVYEELNKGK